MTEEKQPSEKPKPINWTWREWMALLPYPAFLFAAHAANQGMISWWWLIIPAGLALAFAMMRDEEFARGVLGLAVLAAFALVAFAVLKWSAGIVFG